MTRSLFIWRLIDCVSAAPLINLSLFGGFSSAVLPWSLPRYSLSAVFNLDGCAPLTYFPLSLFFFFLSSPLQYSLSAFPDSGPEARLWNSSPGERRIIHQSSSDVRMKVCLPSLFTNQSLTDGVLRHQSCTPDMPPSYRGRKMSMNKVSYNFGARRLDYYDKWLAIIVKQWI